MWLIVQNAHHDYDPKNNQNVLQIYKAYLPNDRTQNAYWFAEPFPALNRTSILAARAR